MRSCDPAAAIRLVSSVVLLAFGAAPALAACPPSCPITGGAPAEVDCFSEFASPVLRLNFPPFDPNDPVPATSVRCFDGDAGCDADGLTDGACVFDVDVCLRNADPELPACAPDDVVAVEVAGAGSDADLAALQESIDALLPATSNVCTEGRTLRVALSGPDSTGAAVRGSKTVELTVHTEGGAAATDRLELTCVPRGWPSYGYNHANHRHGVLERRLGADNATSLAVKWSRDLGVPVTSTPTVGNGLVYVTAWDGSINALRPGDGATAWRFAAGGAVMSTATLTADGRLVASGGTTLVCLDALTGDLLWMRDIRAKAADHVWASPQIANGRVFIGVASLSDVPCVQGRLVALHLDTGTELWTLKTVPERVCEIDTSVECTCPGDAAECEASPECGGGRCTEGRGGGVTATVAIDPSGEIVYMNTVGCFTYPSIGDSDSIFKIEAATGRVLWKERVQPAEQFGFCPDDGARECGSEADCAVGPCQRKRSFHDFGFLNGPLLIDASDGAGGTRSLVVSGSKDGTLYALNPENGSEVWTNPVRPAPVSPSFAGFGLFNGAVGFADERIHAAIDGAPFQPPLQEHLYAFDATDGTTLWTDEIGASWGPMALANGLALVGTGTLAKPRRCADDETRACTNDDDCDAGPCVERGPFYVYDAASGERLAEMLLPAVVNSGASIVDGDVYVGYGSLGSPGGGVVAFTLPSCLGDCDADGSVAIDELTLGVGISLDDTSYDHCPRFDGDRDGSVALTELVGGVGNALGGCE